MLIKPTTDMSLPWLDYSTMTAVNTCPRWGLINSWHGKHLSKGVDRVLPLEAGRAMHDVFACVRFFDLLVAHSKTAKTDNSNSLEYYTAYKRINDYATKLFATAEYPDRWERALTYKDSGEDDITRCMQMCLNLLETSGYYDDARDNKRTMANLENAAINYIQRYPLGRFIPIMTDKHIGVEVPFDVTIYYPDDVPLMRFVGRVDGVCVDNMRPSNTTPEVHENKTGSRIDTVWSNSFDTSHQVTGYCLALSCTLDTPISNVVMWGLQIPVPKSSMYSDGIMRYPTSRDAAAFHEWQEWVMHTLYTIDKYEGDPTNAPMYTHSCNRYFRSCPLIPFCCESDRDKRKHIFEHEMTTQRWSPLAETIDP
jgi:hypothetical protein